MECLSLLLRDPSGADSDDRPTGAEVLQFEVNMLLDYRVPRGGEKPLGSFKDLDNCFTTKGTLPFQTPLCPEKENLSLFWCQLFFSTLIHGNRAAPASE